MFKQNDFASNPFEKSLNDVLKQQNFLKEHLNTLKAMAASEDDNGDGAPEPEVIRECYRHLLALTGNQQHILDDLLAIQKEMLARKSLRQAIEVPSINEYSAGLLRRAHEPLLQLIRDNQLMIQKLFLLWKNLASFLGIQAKQTYQKNLETIGFQLGVEELRIDLHAITWLYKHLEHQRELLEKKLKAINRLALSENFTPELEKKLTEAVEQYQESLALLPELDWDALAQLKEVPTDILAFTHKLSDNEEDEPKLAKHPDVAPHHKGVVAPKPEKISSDPSKAYQAELTNKLQASLNSEYAKNYANHIARQIQALHIQVSKILKHTHHLSDTLDEVHETLRDKPEQSYTDELVKLDRLERDALLRRTLFYKPRI